MSRHHHPGTVLWFSGLSGAGKSTLANLLAEALRKRSHCVQTLDGDDLRSGLCSDLGYSVEDRTENVRRAIQVAGLMAKSGATTLVTLITPLQSLRDMVSAQLPNSLQVFVDAPLATCERRDPKGLYARARAGLLKNFTGLDSPFEPPLHPDLVCRTDEETREVLLTRLLALLDAKTPSPDPQPKERRKTIAVDFDGVIADYHGWQGESQLGTPRQDVLRALQTLRDEGWKIIVHTTRSASAITHYLVQSGVPFDEINQNSDYVTGSVKPVATVYWDDRALCYSGDASTDLERIRSFRTWSGRVGAAGELTR